MQGHIRINTHIYCLFINKNAAVMVVTSELITRSGTLGNTVDRYGILLSF